MNTSEQKSENYRAEFLHLCDSDKVFASSPYLRISTFPNIGMLYLASVLRQSGYEAAYHDRAYDRFDDTFLRNLVSRRPLFIGIYDNIALKADVVEITRRIANLDKDIPIILGGPGHFEHEDYLAAGASAVVAGEADEIITQIARRIEAGADLGDIPGVICEGATAGQAGLAPQVENLDALPHPAWDLAPPGRFRNDLAFIQKNPWYIVCASRGCPYRCAFCSKIYPVGERRYRVRSVDNVIDEIRELRRRYGIRHVKFQDDAFGAKRNWLTGFCEKMIESDLGVQWNCSSIPTCFGMDDEDIFILMKKAGCTSLHFGLQSTSPQMLKEIDRRPEETEILPAIIPAMRRAGLYSLVDLIVGLPGETHETIETHLRYVSKLPAHMIQVFPLQVLPHTPLYDRYPGGRVTELSREEIYGGIRRITRRFMFRPSIIWANLLYIVKNNPGFFITAIRLLPFLTVLAFGKYRMAWWRSKTEKDALGDAHGGAKGQKAI